jgi:hypothetical protein
MNEREVKQQGILYNDLEIWQYELDYMPLHILQSSMVCKIRITTRPRHRIFKLRDRSFNFKEGGFIFPEAANFGTFSSNFTTIFFYENCRL